LRVEIEDEFADHDSLEASCQDYAWLNTNGELYREAWHIETRSNDEVARAGAA